MSTWASSVRLAPSTSTCVCRAHRPSAREASTAAGGTSRAFVAAATPGGACDGACDGACGVALGMALGVALGMALGVALGMALGVALGVGRWTYGS